MVLPIAGMCLFVGSRLHSQTASKEVPDRVLQLTEEKMQVSKLEWIMLMARVRILEQANAHETSRPVSATGMRYDRETKTVIVSGFVDSKWLSAAKIDDVKTVLVSQGVSYCVNGLALAEAEAGEALAGVNAGKDCSVSFFTWTMDQAGNQKHKSVATEEGGRLTLK
jgi:hypothetical protein